MANKERATNKVTHAISEVRGVFSDMRESTVHDLSLLTIPTIGLTAFAGRIALPSSFDHITHAEISSAAFPTIESGIAILATGLLVRINGRRLLNFFRKEDQTLIESAIRPEIDNISSLSNDFSAGTGSESVT